MMRVGSLCTGIRGIELALEMTGVAVDPVFVSDIEPAVNDWLTETAPDVPNLGDFTDHHTFPDCDLLVAGFPCQPVSTAGNRAGVEDERWLFDDIADRVGRMGTRPDLFLENVSGLLTANGGDAMARVVHRLAGLGYVFTWGTLSAAEIGAAHKRLRWWGYATHPDTGCLGRIERPGPSTSEPSQLRRHGPRDHNRTPSADSGGGDAERRRAPGTVARQERTPRDEGRERDTSRDAAGSRSETAPDSGDGETDWGPYAAAVRRWEHILGRPAPAPVDNAGRLSSRFVEWHMGYPDGWVCDTEALGNRRHALHALGNSVVPLCAASAYVQLSARFDKPAATAA